MKKTITLIGVEKTYHNQQQACSILSNIELQINQGDFVSIIGKSGSGKSTLLNIMSAIDQPSKGQVIVNDTDIAHMHPNKLDSWRGRNIGLVFQFFQLIPTLTVLENILLPMDFCKVIPSHKRRARAEQLLCDVGLTGMANKFPSILSGGEKQRVAVARALANDPDIIMADEPTGNLDSATAKTIFNLFCQLNAQGKTVVLVSHDPDCQKYSSKTILISDGEIQAEPFTLRPAEEVRQHA